MKTLLSIAGVFSGFLLSLGMFAAGLAFAAYFIAIEPERRPGLTADVADLWTAEPRRVDTSQQRLERVAALPPSPAAPPEVAAKAVARAGVDPVTTGAIESPPSEVGAAARIIALHVKWCADRYRSYQRYNNRYTSYSGEQRPCVSPFLKGQIGLAETVAPAPPEAFQSDPVEDGDGQAEIIEELPASEEEVEAFSAPTNDANALPWLVEEGQELRAETAEELPAPEEEALPQYALDAEGWVDPDHVSYCFSRYRSYRPQDNSYQPFGGGPRRQCR